MNTILDRLGREFRAGRRVTDPSPIDVARWQLKTSPGGCWPMALQTLRSAYDVATTREAWIALLSEPNSGWSTWDPQAGRWTLYCVPGYDMLCGDSIQACPLGPPQYVYAAPATQYVHASPRPYPIVAAGQAAPSGMTTGQKWLLVFVVLGFAWFVWMSRPDTDEEKRYYAAHRNRRAAA